jgi:hypothetical protein
MPTTKRRIAVNLEDDEYAELCSLAEKNEVSLAWLGRRAVVQFLERCRDQQLMLPFKASSDSRRRLAG